MIKPNNRAFTRGKTSKPGFARGNAFPPLVASAASQSAELFFMPYDAGSQSRNADFISIARRAIHNPRANGPSNLRTLRTLGAKPRQPTPLNPLNLLNPMNPMNPHTAGVSII